MKVIRLILTGSADILLLNTQKNTLAIEVSALRLP